MTIAMSQPSSYAPEKERAAVRGWAFEAQAFEAQAFEAGVFE